jgi:hypothetical protein
MTTTAIILACVLGIPSAVLLLAIMHSSSCRDRAYEEMKQSELMGVNEVVKPAERSMNTDRVEKP